VQQAAKGEEQSAKGKELRAKGKELRAKGKERSHLLLALSSLRFALCL